MQDPELNILIDTLESEAGMSDADFEGVVHALQFLLPEVVTRGLKAHGVRTTDGAMLVADDAYPNWTVHIHGRANDRNGHWHCTLRESDSRDNDAAIGQGRSPVLAQAVLAAVLRLSLLHKTDSNPA